MLQVVESTFRRLKRAELLPAVYAGAQYVNGVPQIVKTQQRLAAWASQTLFSLLRYTTPYTVLWTQFASQEEAAREP